jgi:hypothetical protein
MEEQKEAGQRAKQGERVSQKPFAPPALAAQCIDKNLANRARKAAALGSAGGLVCDFPEPRRDSLHIRVDWFAVVAW